MVKFTIQIIKTYQVVNRLILERSTSSLLLAPGCNFYPSCSEYTIESLKKHGFIKGLAYSAGRMLKCHPWAKLKVDLP